MQPLGIIKNIHSSEEVIGDRLFAVIGITTILLVWALLIFKPQIATGQGGGNAKVGIAIHSGQAVFDPASLG